MKHLLVISMALMSFATIDPCKGVSSKGEPCKMVIGIKNGFCYKHQPDAKHCPHVSPKGKSCGMVTKNGELCRFHSQPK